jgi:hypothetical protein
MSTCKPQPSTPCTPLIHPLRLADRDMFMRFRGGGVGHMYMRHVEPWLDAAGWGATWPSLGDRYPDPTPQEGINTGPAPSTQSLHQSSDDDEDSGEGTDTSGLEDDDGEDPEQPDESDSNDDSDEDTNGSRGANKHTHPRGREDGHSGDDTEDEAEGHNL